MADKYDFTEAELAEKYRDREWRLNHLYFIKNPQGRKVLFKMNAVQKELHDHLWYMNIVPKARKLGVSTFFALLYLDQVLFSENKTAGIIAHREQDVKRLFKDVTLFAVEHLHPWVKEYVGKPEADTANEIRFRNGGLIFVSMTTRSATPQFLHISEYGYICRHFPEKANEILEGAINSVEPGNYVSIESTAEGRGGHFFELCMKAEAKRQRGDKLTPMDFKIHFFPWWKDPRYSLEGMDTTTLPVEVGDYFAKMERQENLRLTMGQKWWYAKKFEVNRDGIYTQYPSTLDECFRVSLKGAYYAREIDSVYKDGRVAFFPVDPRYPVDTAWDIGMRDAMAIVFTQTLGPEIRFVDYIEKNNVGLEWYVKALKEKGYRYGKHVLPHDIQVKEMSSGVSRLESLWTMGISNTVVAPKLPIIDGIERVRTLFPRFRFDEKKSQRVLDALQTCRKEWEETRNDWGDKPVHDENSHLNDAVRYMSVMWVEMPADSVVDVWGDPQKQTKIVSSFNEL